MSQKGSRTRFRRPFSTAVIAACLLFVHGQVLNTALAQSPAQPTSAAWRAATEKELQGLLPARAAVEKEHIETEMRTASGITDGHGQYVAAIVLITAGYAADGKYSDYLVTQVPLQIGDIALQPGEYVIGWERDPNSLNVHIYDAASGTPQGSTVAHQMQTVTAVASIRIWPPRSRQRIQIGRFEMPYTIRR